MKLSKMAKLILSLVDKHIDERDREQVLDILDEQTTEFYSMQHDKTKEELLGRVLCLKENMEEFEDSFESDIDLQPIIDALK